MNYILENINTSYSWSGSIHMSTLLNDVQSRETFVKNVVNMVQKYSLDGVNLDWGKCLSIAC